MPQAISRADFKQVVAFADLAASTKSTADYTCIATVGISPDEDLIILSIVRGRWEWPDARRILVDEVLRQRVRRFGVERVAFQLAAVQEFMRMPELRGVAVQGIAVDKDKVSRALPVAARAEAGKLYLARAAWNRDLIQEFAVFPEGG